MLKNKAILITGANRGLGLAIAKCFWTQGADLVLVVRLKKYIAELKKVFEKRKNQTIKVVAVDFSSKRAVTAFLKNKTVFKKIDVLVNNAAIHGPIGNFAELNMDAWEQAFSVDFFVPARLTQAVLPFMQKKKKGKIINISGGGATGSRPFFTAYAAAKTALARFTEILAEEFPMVQVNGIAPGVMKTQLLSEMLQAGPEVIGKTEFEKAEKAAVAEDSMKNAVELALYLATDESNGISGKIISAIWDPWKTLHQHTEALKNSDVYTLRRIVPKDRGMSWGEK